MGGSKGKKVLVGSAIGVVLAIVGVVLAVIIGIGCIIGGIGFWYGSIWKEQKAKLDAYYKDGYIYVTTPEQFMAVAKNYEVIPNAHVEKDIISGVWTYRDFQKSLIDSYGGIKGYKLGADIDFTGVDVVCNPLYNLSQNGKDPLKENEGKYLGFNGVLDGNGFALKNVTMNGDFASVFGVLGKQAHVFNVRIENSTFTGDKYLGAFLSYVALDDVGGILENCVAENCVVGGETSQFVGGIAGKVISNRDGFVMRDCEARACTVKGYAYTGGVLGWYHASSDCKDEVKILQNLRNRETSVVGYKENSDENGFANVGGVVGCITLDDSAVTVKDCVNWGKISCEENAGLGGIVGRVYYKGKTAFPLYYANKIFFDTCTNYGEINGKAYVGGICAVVGRDIHTANFTDCVNYASVFGTENFVGGICGQVPDDSNSLTGQFDGCSNNTNEGARIIGADYVGGICGKNGIFTGCKNVMNIYHHGEHAGNIGGSPAQTPTGCLEEGNLILLS